MFNCPICQTGYLYEDTATMCAVRKVDDRLKAQKGDKVLITRYYGDEYARDGKAGLVRLWSESYIRDRRIVPISGIAWSEGQRHIVEYKIGDIDKEFFERFPQFADLWETGNPSVLGPKHHWTAGCDLTWFPLDHCAGTWEEKVRSMCYGPENEETIAKLRAEGYPV